MNEEFWIHQAPAVLSVIIPLYNKESAIEQYLDALERTLRSLGEPYEVVLVNDGSTDSSFERVRRRRSSSLRIVEYGRNEGKGFALWYGFYQSRGDRVAFLDADLDLHPRQMTPFLERLARGDADVVIGSKRMPGAKVSYPPLRRFVSLGYQLLVRLLFGLNVRDTQVGLKVFRRPVLDDVLRRVAVKRFAFDLELLVVCHRRGYRIAELPVELTYQFSSTVPLNQAIRRMLWDTAAIFYRCWIRRYYERLHGERGTYKLE